MEETDDRGRRKRTTEARDRRRGIPQGSPISPLLANIYMRRFVLGWKKLGLEHSLGTRIVIYADDLVILCRKGKAEEALRRLRELVTKLKPTMNEEKTRICANAAGPSLGERRGPAAADMWGTCRTKTLVERTVADRARQLYRRAICFSLATCRKNSLFS